MRRFRQGGFTLIELIIAVAIVAILAAVAFPAYTQHLVRTKRSAAQSFMVNVANRQEQAMLNARAYFAASTTAQWTAANITVPAEVTTNYAVSVTVDNNASPPTFTITAQPQGQQAAKDTKCGNLTYNQKAEKGISGPGTVTECWR